MIIRGLAILNVYPLFIMVGALLTDVDFINSFLDTSYQRTVIISLNIANIRDVYSINPSNLLK